MFKRVREEWMYWRYRNITRRWQILKPKLRLRRQARPLTTSARARGTAAYTSTRSSSGRGLVFVVIAAAILAVINTILPGFAWLDIIIFIGLAYGYIRYFSY